MKRAGIALLATAALGGCGSGNAHEPGLTNGQRLALVAQLEAARTAASARDVAGAQTAVQRFQRSVARLRRSGALTDEAARILRIGAARVLARVQSDNEPPPTPAPVVTQTTPGPGPLPPGQAKKHGDKQKGHGKGGEGGD